jgi:hypothetical protein
MIWGVNFGSGTTANAAAMTKSIMTAFASDAVKSKGIVLDFIEIGVCPPCCCWGTSLPKKHPRCLLEGLLLLSCE